MHMMTEGKVALLVDPLPGVQEVVFSYGIPVAATVHGRRYQTETRHSTTTSRHCTQAGYDDKTERKPQEWFDVLLVREAGPADDERDAMLLSLRLQLGSVNDVPHIPRDGDETIKEYCRRVQVDTAEYVLQWHRLHVNHKREEEFLGY